MIVQLAFNDPTVQCCQRDAADCDCLVTMQDVDTAPFQETYPGEDRDYVSMVRMDRLNEQLKVIHQVKLPLCGECLEFHDPKRISCDGVQEMMWADQQIWKSAR